ncbi:MAG: hypothetical protein LBL65_01515 [Campylobacteraceae bacterium]|jgi:hypothetical protein|nr:hypothetical protein [Campylobacteraceae bacterium]
MKRAIKVILYLIIVFLIIINIFFLIARQTFSNIENRKDEQKYLFMLEKNSSEMFYQYYYYYDNVDRNTDYNKRLNTVNFLLKYSYLNNDVVCLLLIRLYPIPSYRKLEILEAIKKCQAK